MLQGSNVSLPITSCSSLTHQQEDCSFVFTKDLRWRGSTQRLVQGNSLFTSANKLEQDAQTLYWRKHIMLKTSAWGYENIKEA